MFVSIDNRAVFHLLHAKPFFVSMKCLCHCTPHQKHCKFCEYRWVFLESILSFSMLEKGLCASCPILHVTCRNKSSICDKSYFLLFYFSGFSLHQIRCEYLSYQLRHSYLNIDNNMKLVASVKTILLLWFSAFTS